LLVLALAAWAEAAVAVVIGDQVLQCSMSAHDMQAMGGMPCCPMDDVQSPATSPERPSCCSVSEAPEQPLGFVVSAQQRKAPTVEVAAVLPAMATAPAVDHFRMWRSADAPRFVKPVLELKTDLRI
jgi:hypothetical protein